MLNRKDSKRAAIKASRFNLVIAGLAVFAGGLVYVLCRSSYYTFQRWLQILGPEGLPAFHRDHPAVTGLVLPDWIVFSLPDGLWAFAYTLIILTIWNKSDSIFKYFWYATIPILTFGSEFLQWPGIIPGTFCLNDLVLLSCGLFAGIVAAKRTLRQSIHENEQEIWHAG